jgi:uncharacterized membrane protein YkvA (DUF1232 family)
MLNALQGQLKLLAADPKDPFPGILRRLAGPKEAARYEQPLRALVLAMPAMTGQIRDWVSESKWPSPIKRMHAFIMAYLYSPEDFLPESSMGFFGYVDDAYLVAQVYRRTLLEAGCFGFKRFVVDEALSRDVPVWLKTVSQLLPAETAAMDHLLEESVLRRDGDFSELLSRAARDGRATGCRLSSAQSGGLRRCGC